MDTTLLRSPSELAIELTPALMRRLRTESRRLDVPIEYLVASIVVDTMEPDADATAAAPSRARRAGAAMVA